MKLTLFLLISLISIVNCDSNEVLKLSQWLSNPDFDFSQVPSEEKSLCQKHLELYTKSLTGSNGLPKPWAIKMLDSTAKFPDGALDFHIVLLGNMEECIDIDVPSQPVGDETMPGFSGKYLYSNFGYKTNDNERIAVVIPNIGDSIAMAAQGIGIAEILSFGMCVPSSCSNGEEIFAGLNTSLTLRPKYTKVKDEIIELDGLDKAFIVFCSFVLICTLLGTSLEAWEYYFEEANKPEKPFSRKFFLNFGLYRNTSSFLDTSPPKGDHLGCLDGIRFLSMSWVFMGHFLGDIVTATFPIRNLFQIVQRLYGSYPMDAIRNAYVSVDSFFMISGVLVTYLMLKELDRNRRVNYPLMYIHRYLRLTGSYAFVMFMVGSVFRHIKTGPLRGEVQCETVWAHLLYLNNFVWNFAPTLEEGREKYGGGCIGQTWYMANDMQFFIIAPPIIWLVWQYKKLGLLVIGGLTALSCAIPTALTYKNGWAPVPGFPGPKPNDPANDFMLNSYIKPYTRFTPYIMGILLGYFLHITKNKPVKINYLVNIWLWAVSWVVGVLVVYGLTLPDRADIAHGDPNLTLPLGDGANAIYAGFHRLGWSFALGWVIFACCRGYGGWVNEFLSWSAFKPLSKISFILYLIHLDVIPILKGTLHFEFDMSVTLMVIFLLSALFYNLVFSAVLYVLIELPYLQTEKLLFSLILNPKRNKQN